MELNFLVDKNEDIMILKKNFHRQMAGQAEFIELYSLLKNEGIEKYYNKINATLESNLIEIEKKWLEIEDMAINKIKDIFPEVEIGKINCLVSINPFNPRFIKEKFFLVNFESKWPNEIIIHELLHFYFFEYCLVNYNDIFQNTDINSGWAWDLSELFNFIVLNDIFWKNLLEVNQISYYEEHEKYLEEFQMIWKNKDLNELILKGIEILKNNKNYE